MLFDKKREPLCTYCEYYIPLTEDNGFCEKKGPVEAGGQCRAFLYDPTRRVPPSALTEEELPVFDPAAAEPAADEEFYAESSAAPVGSEEESLPEEEVNTKE